MGDRPFQGSNSLRDIIRTKTVGRRDAGLCASQEEKSGADLGADEQWAAFFEDEAEKAEADISRYMPDTIGLIRAWGMSLTSFRDIHRFMVRADIRPAIRMILAHPSGPGRVWIEPENGENAPERRSRAIREAVKDYGAFGADMRFMDVDDLPLTTGVIFDHSLMVISAYRYEAKPGIPFRMMSQLSRERASAVIRDMDLIDQFVLPEYDRFFEGCLPPGHPGAYFKSLMTEI